MVTRPSPSPEKIWLGRFANPKSTRVVTFGNLSLLRCCAYRFCWFVTRERRLNLVFLTFCRFLVTVSSSHCFNKKWFVKLLVLPLVPCSPKPDVRLFPFFLAKFIFRILLCRFAALIGFFVIVKGLGGERLPDCGEERWRNFPRSLSFPPGAPLILQWLSPLPAISSAKYSKILSDSGSKPPALKYFLISPGSLRVYRSLISSVF